jgi:hypothetical protein
VKCRGYSLCLQRRITDSGADVPFGKVSEKLYEHYGINIPYSPIRKITENHAEAVRESEYPETEIPEHGGFEYKYPTTSFFALCSEFNPKF